MCDSPVMRSASDQSALPECSQSWTNDYSGSEVSQSTLELQRFDGSLIQGRDSAIEARNRLSGSRRNRICPYRFQLEQDVQKLQEQLQEEMELHKVLEHAFNKNAVKSLSTSCLPLKAQELLSSIGMLEVAVSKLENQMVALHFQLSQERNERRLAEYRMRHSSSGLKSLCMSDNLERMELRDQPSHPVGEICFQQPVIQEDQSARSDSSPHSENASTSDYSRYSSSPNMFLTMNPLSGLWDYPNKLSEEMVRCMKNIFISLADSAVPCQQPSPSSQSQLSPLSPQGILSSSSWWSSSDRSQSLISSWVQSPQVDVQSNLEVLAVENACDPYRVRGKLSWADIGTYGLVIEVSWMSVGKKQLEYAAGALRKFRTLVEQLAKVNPIHLSNDEKLAFWINLYNAMIMHGYLAYGVPKSDLKLFSLMQKAAYTVGGHSFTATSIEFGILKMKSPLHRPQIALLLALHKMKMSEEQRKSAIDAYEPLVAFGLSCGMYSSPAVRIYTAKKVREELQEAQLDYIRASVGVSSKGRLLVPKMVHCFAKMFVDDSNLAVWISHYLPGCQAAFVERCVSQRRQKTLLTSRNCYGILPFDSRFRYLFLPENMTSSTTVL